LVIAAPTFFDRINNVDRERIAPPRTCIVILSSAIGAVEGSSIADSWEDSSLGEK
jgi:hypothetical protein